MQRGDSGQHRGQAEAQRGLDAGEDTPCRSAGHGAGGCQWAPLQAAWSDGAKDILAPSRNAACKDQSPTTPPSTPLMPPAWAESPTRHWNHPAAAEKNARRSRTPLSRSPRRRPGVRAERAGEAQEGKWGPPRPRPWGIGAPWTLRPPLARRPSRAYNTRARTIEKPRR